MSAPGERLIDLFARLVPAALRAEWRAEWRAELLSAAEDALERGESSARTRWRLRWRALASLLDAGSLRRLHRGAGPGPVLRDAFRIVRRQPAFVATVAVTLALGMGAATAIFSVVDAVLLHPLPFPDADRLVQVRGAGTAVDPQFREALGTETRLFESVSSYSAKSVVLTEVGEPQQLRLGVVEPGFLALLGITPQRGRMFTAQEAVDGRDQVLLIGDDVWRSAFQSDPGVVGRTVKLTGETYTIIGVLPRTLRILPGGLVSGIVPLTHQAAASRVAVLGRLRPGVSREAAQSQLVQLAAALDEQEPLSESRRVEITGLEMGRFRGEQPVLLALSGAVILLLLIACANAAGLLFVQGISRQSELTVRRALGGTRSGLFRQLFIESLMVALVAGALGTLIAWGGVRILVAMAPEILTRWHYHVIALNGRALGFSLLTTLATGVLFGVVPAAWAAGESRGIPVSNRTATVSRSHLRMRYGVQIVQLALASMLLCGAVLLGRSFVALLRVDPGFDMDHVAELALSPPGERSSAVRQSFVTALTERLRAIPGVTDVGWSNGSGLMFQDAIYPEGGEPVSTSGRILMSASMDPGFLAAYGTRLLAGRGFTSADLTSGDTNVIIDPDLAELLWPGTDPIGRRFRLETGGTVYTTVGLAPNVRWEGPDDRDRPWSIFYPGRPEQFSYARLALRTATDPATVLASARAALRSIDPDRPIYYLRTARQGMAEELAMPRFALALMSVFGILALLLASVGVYGLVAFSVARRSREIGVRMAMGATTRTVVLRVLRSGLVLAVAGVMLGIGGALLLSRYLGSLLFGISRLDAATYGMVVLILLLTTTLALLRPALRAGRLEPYRALRDE